MKAHTWYRIQGEAMKTEANSGTFTHTVENVSIGVCCQKVSEAEAMVENLTEILGEGKAKLLKLNREALALGYDYSLRNREVTEGP